MKLLCDLRNIRIGSMGKIPNQNLTFQLDYLYNQASKTDNGQYTRELCLVRFIEFAADRKIILIAGDEASIYYYMHGFFPRLSELWGCASVDEIRDAVKAYCEINKCEWKELGYISYMDSIGFKIISKVKTRRITNLLWIRLFDKTSFNCPVIHLQGLPLIDINALLSEMCSLCLSDLEKGEILDANKLLSFIVPLTCCRMDLLNQHTKDLLKAIFKVIGKGYIDGVEEVILNDRSSYRKVSSVDTALYFKVFELLGIQVPSDVKEDWVAKYRTAEKDPSELHPYYDEELISEKVSDSNCYEPDDEELLGYYEDYSFDDSFLENADISDEPSDTDDYETNFDNTEGAKAARPDNTLNQFQTKDDSNENCFPEGDNSSDKHSDKNNNEIRNKKAKVARTDKSSHVDNPFEALFIRGENENDVSDIIIAQVKVPDYNPWIYINKMDLSDQKLERVFEYLKKSQGNNEDCILAISTIAKACGLLKKETHMAIESLLYYQCIEVTNRINAYGNYVSNQYRCIKESLPDNFDDNEQ